LVRNLTLSLADRLTPSAGIFKRFQHRVLIPDGVGAGNAARVMACPQLTGPLAMALRDTHPDWLLPGLGNFPDNRATLLATDGAFLEAFLAGANHEMNREFLWREYPTDQRGTPFRYFWPRPDRSPDIPPITEWDAATELGRNGAKGGPDLESMTVLLVRGELLHRYPRTLAYAAKGILANNKSTFDPDETNWMPPDFALNLDDRTTAFAYNLDPGLIRSSPANPAGYYFVFSEPITGPRFNFDTDGKPMAVWADLDWGQVIDARGFAFGGKAVPTPPKPFDPQGAAWNNDAADIARIAFARPVRIAYHADELLAPPGA
jgi:hypothetical protein